LRSLNELTMRVQSVPALARYPDLQFPSLNIALEPRPGIILQLFMLASCETIPLTIKNDNTKMKRPEIGTICICLITHNLRTNLCTYMYSVHVLVPYTLLYS